MHFDRKTESNLPPAVDWRSVAVNVDVFVTSEGNVELTERVEICSVKGSQLNTFCP